MATLVQQPPYQTEGHSFQKQHHQRQQHQAQPTYTASIPILLENAALSGIQPNFYKQINIIPGLDANNAVVDTDHPLSMTIRINFHTEGDCFFCDEYGVQMVRPTGSHVQVSSNTAAANNDFDGKRMRRSIQRRTVDYNASMLQMVKHRLYKRSVLQKPVIQPDPLYYPEIIQPRCLLDNPINSVTTRFVRASTNKIRCPVFTVAWTPEGRRVVTGTSSGEFTLWNGLTFNFETILQAHESAVRAMEWSHNDMWLLSGDHNGVIKYWQSNMNNVKMIQAHTDPVRGLSFCPTDNKFVTCSDDGLLKVWDFYRCVEERALRGHGADVKCVGWHPFKCIVASGSKDSQQPLKLWDPKSGNSLATIHGHKSTVMGLDWNKNGNWLLTGSRDRLVKVYDIRMMKEIFTFRGHKKEAASVNWHPLYEEMFASGGSDGSIMFWLLGCEKELGCMEHAHDGMIWDLKWHPLGHILCSGSNDHTTKFWTRNRPGDKMRDKYNLNILPTGFDDDYEYELPNTSQSEADSSMLDSSRLNSSLLSSSTPSKTKLEQSDLESPAVKALLEQNSLEVVKSQVTETPAQIYTVSQLRPTAPIFKIDTKKQKKAIDDVENIEKRRERMLCKGDEKSNKRRRTSNHDDVAAANAPSLLDLNITAPAFLKDHEWGDDSEPPPFIEDLKSMAAEKNPDAANKNLFPTMSNNNSSNSNSNTVNNMDTTNNFPPGGNRQNNFPANNPSGFSTNPNTFSGNPNNFPANNHPNNFPGSNPQSGPPSNFTGNAPPNNFPGNSSGQSNFSSGSQNKYAGNMPPNKFQGNNPPQFTNNPRPSNPFPESNVRRFDGPPPPPPPPRPPMMDQHGQQSMPPPNNRVGEFNNRPPPPDTRFNNRPPDGDPNFNRMNGPPRNGPPPRHGPPLPHNGPPPPHSGPPPPHNGPPPPHNGPPPRNNEQFQNMPPPPGRPGDQRSKDPKFNRPLNGTNHGPMFEERFNNDLPPNKQWEGERKNERRQDDRTFRRNDARR